MQLSEIYKPIEYELSKLESGIRNQALQIDADQQIVRDALQYFFNTIGKHLRPALIFYSAKAVNDNGNLNNNIISLAVAVELIHNASLIHDDIVDEENNRRGISSLNRKFGNKIAMLIGDIVYTKAFLLLINNADKNLLRIVTNCVEKMCYGEVNELLYSGKFNYNEYLKIIDQKTAYLMSTCCEIGAIAGGGNINQVECLKSYGKHFGFAYQIIDDYNDGELPVEFSRELFNKARNHVQRAKVQTKKIGDTIAINKMCDLANYIISDKIEVKPKSLKIIEGMF